MNNLSWKLHMDFVLRKICVSYGTIKKISKHSDKKTLLVQLPDNQSYKILELGILVIKPQPQKFNESLINLYD